MKTKQSLNTKINIIDQKSLHKRGITTLTKEYVLRKQGSYCIKLVNL